MTEVDWSEAMVEARRHLRQAEASMAKADYEEAWDLLSLAMSELRQVASILATKRLQ